MSLGAKDVLSGSFTGAWQTLEATMGGVTQEIADRPVPGRALAVGAAYAHAVIAADNLVNGMLAGRAPLGAGEWAGRTGASAPMPMPGGQADDLGGWYRTVRIDLDACHAYATAVWESIGAYLAAATDEDLAKPVDMSFAGAGMLPAGLVFSLFITAHLNNLTGEISAIKGVHGLKGYPF